MRVGNWTVSAVMDGTFGLDGGSMFGVVPRSLWTSRFPPDERNRITMALRALLIEDGQRRIVVDAGIGRRFDRKQQEIYRYQELDGGLVSALARLGVEASDVTDVIATHLHFDHVAGLLTPDASGDLVPTFPNAVIHIQEDAWSWAHSPSAWDEASFFHSDFVLWERLFKLHLLRGDAELAPGVRVQSTRGHTPGHQIVVVGESTETLVYCADLIPTAAHVRLPYIMAYDHRPLLTLEEKKVLLAQALEEDWILVFEHDPDVAACRLDERDGRVVAGEQFELDPS